MTRVFSTRTGALIAAALLALAAAAAVLVYLENYRSSVNHKGGAMTVLVATRTIPEFTPGSQVVDGNMFRTAKVSADSLADGAIADPDQLRGLVARNDVYPGEQITTNQFQRSQTTSVAVKLKPDQRAISFPIDPAAGLLGQVQTGDHVDVVASFDVQPVGRDGLPLSNGQPIALTKTIVNDALVLEAPSASATGAVSSANRTPTLVLAISVKDVDQVLFAQEKGSVWFALRPPGSAEDVKPDIVDVGAVLRGASQATGPVMRLTGARR